VFVTRAEMVEALVRLQNASKEIILWLHATAGVESVLDTIPQLHGLLYRLASARGFPNLRIIWIDLDEQIPQWQEAKQRAS
jgi:hypothetical protein